MTDIDALRIAKESVGNVSIANMYMTLHSAYRVFVQQLGRGRDGGSLGEIATYTLGTWTYLYEQQSTTKIADAPKLEDPVLTLDDVLLEYLPPTHPHLPLLLGYTVALFIDHIQVIRPLLPSLILLTNTVSRRGALELTHTMFSIVDPYYWEDFALCMAISKLIGREDEYLHWLSENMSGSFALGKGLGHLLRLGREYPSFAPAVVRAVRLAIPVGARIPVPDTPSVNDWALVYCTELVQLVCTYSLESKSTKHLIQLANALPPRQTLHPSLALLVHLTIKAILPNYPETNLLPLTKRNLTFDDDEEPDNGFVITRTRPPPAFDLLRNVLPPEILKQQITELLSFPKLSSLGIAIARDWKDHINYDDEDYDDPDNLESTSDFLDRVEREYLTETEGVKWRFEDVLAEWIGEWPDGKEMGSSKIPRTKRIVLKEEDSEAEGGKDEEEEEWAGSLVKRVVPRSGLVMETPLQSRGVFNAKTERKAVLERLFKLSSIGRSGRSERIKDLAVEDSNGGSFLKRINSQQSMAERYKWPESEESTHVEVAEINDDGRARKRRLETIIYKDSDPERQIAQTVKSNPRKRRRFDVDNTDDDSEGSVYEESNDVENQSVQSASELDPSTSDIDELSISISNPRPALRGILNLNHKLSHRTFTTSRSKSLLIRESSPILLDDPSDDELAI